MLLSILVCLAAFAALVWIIRRDPVSLGIPIAYLFLLLLIHVPGAFAHLVGRAILLDNDLTETGIVFTSIGAVCFVVGVFLARAQPSGVTATRVEDRFQAVRMAMTSMAERHQFAIFCLAAGWFFTYGLSFLRDIPTLGAAIEKGGGVWMLGVMLGLRDALQRRDRKWIAIWLGSLAVYPVMMLVLGGFLSYGSTAVVIVLAALAVSTRSHLKVAGGFIVAVFLGFNVFLSYFEHRDAIREAAWGGAPFEQRVEQSWNMITDFSLFDAANETHLNALDQRLNQNYFTGLAAKRLDLGQVEYLHGRSIWEGVIAVVPRALWPEKPVTAGSPKIVGEMTGLILSDTTSFGVGNVMEFHINFGIPGIIGGFLILGWLIGTLDRKAAIAEAQGEYGRTIVYFLPAVALIQPNGSMVELVGGSISALIAAYGWRYTWRQWQSRGRPSTTLPAHLTRRGR
jgi:hypothetical protein